MTREAMDVCLRVLKESNKSRFDSYSVRNSILIISHITFRECRAHIFSDNLSQNSCILSHSVHTAKIEIRECVNNGKSLTVRPKKWSRSLTAGGRLLEVPTIRI